MATPTSALVEGLVLGAATDSRTVPSVTGRAVGGIRWHGAAANSRRSPFDAVPDNGPTLQDGMGMGGGGRKKSVATAALSSVDNTMLAMAAVRVDGTLKGLALGVMEAVLSALQVRIRGFGTIDISEPLGMVGGMPIRTSINYLDTSPIERLDVLTNVASSTVHGPYGDNAVNLLTTKCATNAGECSSVSPPLSRALFHTHPLAAR